MTKHLCLPILVFCMLLSIACAAEKPVVDASTEKDDAVPASGQSLSAIFTAYLPYAFNHQFSGAVITIINMSRSCTAVTSLKNYSGDCLNLSKYYWE